MAAILVVDDDPGIADLLSFDLTRAGHRVTIAVDGADAATAARAARAVSTASGTGARDG